MPTGVRFCGGGGGSGGGEAGNSCHSKSSRVQSFTPIYTLSHFHLFFLFFLSICFLFLFYRNCSNQDE